MANDFNSLFPRGPSGPPPLPLAPADANPNGAALGTYDDEELKALWVDIKKQCIDTRLVFETQWKRNILYILERQWIEWHSAYGWRDKRMAQWVPRPTTPKCKETIQTIRAMLTSVRLGVNVRPNGADPKNVSAAATADELSPVLHEKHNMNAVQQEGDYWLLATGNSFLHSYVEYDIKHGVITDPTEQCVTCSSEYRSSEIAEAKNRCPECGGASFIPALDEDDDPITNAIPRGKPVTIALSPFELAFPNDYIRFDDLPYVVRLRWRTKTYYEDHPQLKEIAKTIAWQKSPTDQSLSLFKSLAQYNDMGISPSYLAGGLSGQQQEDGAPEYEIWMKPCNAYPQGLVFRIIGDAGDVIPHLEETEAIPGPLPYKDADGQPLFTFAHTGYEHVGGRILASGPIDVICKTIDKLNQLDSGTLLSHNRMSNPVWMIPKGAEPTKITGMPGLTIEWNAMAFGGTAKPERIEGVGPHPSTFTIRDQYLKDIEEATGCLDGDTAIPCLNGQTLTMRELAEQFPSGGIWVYGFDPETMRVVPSFVEHAWSVGVKPTVRVAFAEGTAVDCTPDHPFLTYGRGYVRADELRVDEAVVPLLLHEAGRYLHITQPVDRKTEPVHRMVMFGLGELARGASHLDVHHLDDHGRNNDPANLQVLTRSAHLKRTPRRFNKTSQQQSASSRARWKGLDSAARLEATASMHEGEAAYWANLSSSDRSARNVAVWAKKSSEERKVILHKMIAKRRTLTAAERLVLGEKQTARMKAYWATKTEDERQAQHQKMRANHRVASVTVIEDREVFDLTTTTHNFGTAAGVFVHNTFDIMKGSKPPNVEAFSAMQLLVEQSRSRFASVFLARGETYKQWFKFAIELEREFGPDELTKATLSPAKKWTFKNFKRAQLQGSMSVVVEDGSNVPKTTLGMRAALDHANQLGMVNMKDPDQQYEGLKLMGLTKMVPTLDVHIQAALQKQQAFEDWTQDPAAQQQSLQQTELEQQQYVASIQAQPPPTPDPMTGALPPLPPPPSSLNATPLKWRGWYNAMIHRQEFLKWANSDAVRELLMEQPNMEPLLAQHLTEIEQGMLQQAQLQMAMAAPTPSAPMQGGGRAMRNSNAEGTKDQSPKGTGEDSQNTGPA